MLLVEHTNKFKKDFKLAKRRGKNLDLLLLIMKQIESEEPLASKFKDHPLIGNWHSHRELHIESDWLLIYQLVPSEKTVIFTRTGTHSDLY